MIHSSHLPHTRRLWLRFLILILVALVLAIVFLPKSTSPSGLLCGDIDHNGRVTAADLIWMINYIFRGGVLPDPPEVADVNYDGTVNLSDVIFLVNYVYKKGAPPVCPPYGLPVTVSGCKLFSTAVDSIDPPPNQDCIEWHYDGASELRIRHLNAGFNCCPTEIVVNAYVDTGAIFIEEREFLDYGGCDCLCLIDLEFTIANVHPGHYAVMVIEPYAQTDDDPLAALITLEPYSDSGVFCVERSNYPWQPGAIKTESVSGCKTLNEAFAPDSISLSDDCIEYLYDTSGVLHITRLNGGFNCCAVPAAYLEVVADTVRIVEYDSYPDAGACHCLCLFDVEFAISGLPRGTYVIRLEQMYLQAGDSQHEFPVDFDAAPSGSDCIVRAHYPWPPRER